MLLIRMVAISEETVQRIRQAQEEVEPLIVNLIQQSDEGSCPYKVIREGDIDSKEMKDAVTKVARLLYKNGLLNKLSLSLSNEEAYDTLLYAFGYWGGNTLFRHGENICKCRDRCY